MNQLKSEIKMYCLRNGNISIRSCKSRMISSSRNSLMQKKWFINKSVNIQTGCPSDSLRCFSSTEKPQKKLFNTHLDTSYQNKAIPKYSRFILYFSFTQYVDWKVRINSKLLMFLYSILETTVCRQICNQIS